MDWRVLGLTSAANCTTLCSLGSVLDVGEILVSLSTASTREKLTQTVRQISVLSFRALIYFAAVGKGQMGLLEPIINAFKGFFMLTPEQGGETLVWLATSDEVAGKSGLYFMR